MKIKKETKQRTKDILIASLIVYVSWGILFTNYAIPAIGEYTGLASTLALSERLMVAPVMAEEVKEVEIDEDVLLVLVGTEMEGAIPHIEKASEYYGIPKELYLGVGFAESSFNRFKCYNPWGVDTGKGNDPRCYQSWEHSVNGFSQLIKYYYLNEGKITAEQLQRKYVGWDNKSWIKNVKTYYNPEIIIK